MPFWIGFFFAYFLKFLSIHQIFKNAYIKRFMKYRKFIRLESLTFFVMRSRVNYATKMTERPFYAMGESLGKLISLTTRDKKCKNVQPIKILAYFKTFYVQLTNIACNFNHILQRIKVQDLIYYH